MAVFDDIVQTLPLLDIKDIGQASENANRIAVYNTVMKRTGNNAEAVEAANDVLNFSRHGSSALMRGLTTSVPFMNARLQGLHKVGRGYKQNPGAVILKGSILMGATVALALQNMGEDEYDELPEWDKDTYYHIFHGARDENGRSKHHWRIPKPFEMGAIFSTIPERLLRFIEGADDGDVIVDRMSHMVGETFALNPTPQLVKPLIEQWGNRSFFTGRPIVGMSDERLLPEAQYNDRTTNMARLAGEATGTSPKRIDSLVRGYFGTLGQYTLAAADGITSATGIGDFPEKAAARPEDMPLIKRFIRSQQPYSTKYSTLFYDMSNEVNELQATINAYEREGRTEDAATIREEAKDKLQSRGRLNKVRRKITAVNSKIKLTHSSRKLTKEQKRERLDELHEERNKLYRVAEDYEDIF